MLNTTLLPSPAATRFKSMEIQVFTPTDRPRDNNNLDISKLPIRAVIKLDEKPTYWPSVKLCFLKEAQPGVAMSAKVLVYQTMYLFDSQTLENQIKALSNVRKPALDWNTLYKIFQESMNFKASSEKQVPNLPELYDTLQERNPRIPFDFLQPAQMATKFLFDFLSQKTSSTILPLSETKQKITQTVYDISMPEVDRGLPKLKKRDPLEVIYRPL